jgi:hypothetical protein
MLIQLDFTEVFMNPGNGLINATKDFVIKVSSIGLLTNSLK